MTAETWAPSPTYQGYEVSDLGGVRSSDRTVTCKDGRVRRYKGRVLTPYTTKRGYLTVSPGFSKTSYVHSLVLEAFEGPAPVGMECRHLNGNAGDNRLVNLQWGSTSANAFDRVRHRTHDRTARTRCPRDHPLVRPNLVLSPSLRGRRNCRSCDLARRRLRRLGADITPDGLKKLADAYYVEITSRDAAA